LQNSSNTWRGEDGPGVKKIRKKKKGIKSSKVTDLLFGRGKGKEAGGGGSKKKRGGETLGVNQKKRGGTGCCAIMRN